MVRETGKASRDKPPARVRRGYFECRYGQLHVHHAMPPGGGFEEGAPLLCLHDCPSSGRAFVPFLEFLGADRSGYAPDMPGFGESDPPPSGATPTEYAAALADFLDTMRLRRVDLLAVGAGAFIATELALARPAQIGRVVMLSVPLPGVCEQAEHSGTAPPAQVLRTQIDPIGRYPARERLPRLTHRVLVVRGADELHEPSGRVRELVAGARLVELELQGAQLLAKPQRLLDAMRDFLRS